MASGTPVLVMPAGRDRYALPLADVREVLRAPVVTPLPRSRPELHGVVNLRGQLVPLFDTGVLLGTPATDPAYAVVVTTAEGPAALSAAGLPSADVLGEAVGPSDHAATTGTYRVGGHVVVALDAGALLSRGR